MNAARRRKHPDGLPNRVYARDGSFYWVRPDNKWIRLARVAEGENRMLERLVEEKKLFDPVIGRGNLPRIIDVYIEAHAKNYADTYRDTWVWLGESIKKYFRDWNVEQVDPQAVEDFLVQNWPDKLRSQQAAKGWLSGFFSWCVRKKHVYVNPCREVKIKKPKTRDVYIPDTDFLAIREALMMTLPREHGHSAKVPTGPMMQCFVDLCYLTCQRSTEIRLLEWDQIDREAGVIHFVPTKTEESSGEAVDWPITPDIDAVLARAKLLEPAFGQKYVIRDKKGNPKTESSCRSAWNGAKERAKLESKPYTIKDIRAKAMTDAKRAGYDIDALQVAGAHTDRATTEIYIKSREVPVSKVLLHLPAKKSA
ncbi:tyrosine-type recombinase/integrase [Paraburkholderia ferrariae]|uniref:Tyrosine-type recombinase/integrase n=1 Tax=Paraburkholderia ferrariae TaxID=386056 RepID=A0ABU9RYE8_9BURK